MDIDANDTLHWNSKSYFFFFLLQGFVVMLDKFVSFSLNTEVGLFVFIMLRESREDRFQWVCFFF